MSTDENYKAAIANILECERLDDKMQEVRILAMQAQDTDGLHHKDWYAREIVKLLGGNETNMREGIAP